MNEQGEHMRCNEPWRKVTYPTSTPCVPTGLLLKHPLRPSSSNSFVQKEVEEKEEKTKWFTVCTFVLSTA